MASSHEFEKKHGQGAGNWGSAKYDTPEVEGQDTTVPAEKHLEPTSMPSAVVLLQTQLHYACQPAVCCRGRQAALQVSIATGGLAAT